MSRASLPPTPWGELPPTLRALLISPFEQTSRWLRQALADDYATDVVLVEATALADGLTRLREESFDAVLIEHAPERLDALAAVDAVRTGTSEDQPILVVGMLPDCQMAALCFESGADAYVCLNATTTRAFLWQLARAAERHQLLRENQRLRRSRANRVNLEREEAERLIAHQRELIADQPDDGTSDLAASQSDATLWQPPASSTEQYRALLQAFVVLGGGGLAEEIEAWIRTLHDQRWTARQAMCVHVQAVEQLIQELGCRSSRHVMNRANLLAMHILLSICDHATAAPISQCT